MKIYSISDLHLSLSGQKPMEVFGEGWDNYLEKIKQDWKSKVTSSDLVLIAGDISWAMKLEEFEKDLDFFDDLEGKIVFTKGNHDYWWNSATKVKNVLRANQYIIQNDFLRFDNILIGGTRGWVVPEENAELCDEDKKIYDRELIRTELSLQSLARERKDDDKVVFMIHYPPFNSRRTQNEFMALFEKYKVDVVVYGHLHGKNVRAIKDEKINGVRYYLTSTDQIQHQLVSIDF